MKLSDFKALTFDCYGTLIDWESGITAALGPLIERLGRPVSGDEALAAFSAHESEEERRTPDAVYPDILARVHDAIARDWGLEPDPALATAFGASVPDWPAFPDSAAALGYLKQHYKLVILSNVHRAGFAASNKRLEVDFDAIYTAQDVGSYKPDPRNFEYLLAHLKQDLGIGRDEILHTAESLFHDHVPAKTFGLASAWIHRRAEKGGFGATQSVGETPEVDFYFTSMAAMAEAHRAEVGS
ncbi:MAG: haloacid dehalogenase type II [Alphaproteobacteria bacterium]|jgi:2-haloalkanoic acid dehalogenase type II|nr:haloacid dehalogenase type II [Alphaproteobacteria bacterium]